MPIRTARPRTSIPFALVLAAIACDADRGASAKPAAVAPSAPAASASASVARVVEPQLAPPAVAPSASDVQKLGWSTTALGDDLLARVDASGAGNVVYAPASISAALAMTYAGARGNTAAEMAKTLHFDALGTPGDSLHVAWNQQLASWSVTSEKEPRLEVANRLFGQKGYAFVPAFLALTRDRYGAPLEPVDFIGATEAARLRINEWVSDRTAKAIPNLLAPGVLDGDSRLALVNAVHFKGAWSQPFEPSATRAEPFEAAPGSKVDVPTMRGEIDGRYVDGKDAQIVALPFKSAGALSLELDVVLPKAGAAPSFAAWSRAIDGGGHAAVDLSLPKFKIGSSFQLGKTLAEMGMPTAFLPAADFGAMATGGKLFISSVVHQAMLDVSESGAEAAAATAVVMSDESARMTVRMRVDRPFYVMIRDRKSGALLFAAHVRNPKG